MSIDHITREILKMSPHDRAIIAGKIWESLKDPYKFSTDISEEEALDLAQQRDDEIEQGAVPPLSHKELFDRLRR